MAETLRSKAAAETDRPRHALQRVVDDRPDLANELAELLADNSGRYPAAKIAAALREEGLDYVTPTSVRNYRAGHYRELVLPDDAS